MITGIAWFEITYKTLYNQEPPFINIQQSTSNSIFLLPFRLKKFLVMAEAMLEYFKPNLGRIEIIGGAKRIERVYFDIMESSLEQWQKPQVSRYLFIK